SAISFVRNCSHAVCPERPQVPNVPVTAQNHLVSRPWLSSIGSKPPMEHFRKNVVVGARPTSDIDRDLYEICAQRLFVDPQISPPLGELRARLARQRK